MSSGHRKKPPHQAVSIDDAEIDFSSVVKAKEEAQSSKQLAALVAAAAQEQQHKQDVDSHGEARAMDPGLAAYVARSAENGVGRRRKRTFGASAAAPAEVTTTPDASTPAPVLAEPALVLQAASPDVLTDFLQHTTAASRSTLRQRETAYRTALHTFSTRVASVEALEWVPPRPPATSTSSTDAADQADVNDDASSRPTSSGFPLCASQTNSLIDAFFSQGVPDMEPWDQWAFTAPRYDPKAIAVHAHNPKSISNAKMDLVPHPVLPASLYMQRYAEAKKATVPMKLMQTRDELRAERKERLKQKQQRAREERERKKKAGAAAGIVVGGSEEPDAHASAASHDRVSFKHMAYNLFDASVLNPLAVDSKVMEGYQERFLEHQRRNHARHVEAIPNQIAKRERDARRHAEDNPSLCAYRVYPIYSAQHLGMLRNFANDNRLRGFVMWVAQCDALLVLAGGRVSMRHLDRWIVHKTDWESPDTRATRLCRVPLPAWDTFSFHNEKKHAHTTTQGPPEKRSRTEQGNNNSTSSSGDPRKKVDDDREHVFINQVDTVEEGEYFLRTVVPAGGEPWSDLCALWRHAFLSDGLAAPPPAEQTDVPVREEGV